MAREFGEPAALFMRRNSVHPPGSVIVRVCGRTLTDATVKSPAAVAAGTGSTSEFTPDNAAALAAPRNALPDELLNDSSVRPSVHKISALGVSPRPCGIDCEAGAAP